MAPATVLSCATAGLDGELVDVEADAGEGLPGDLMLRRALLGCYSSPLGVELPCEEPLSPPLPP